MRPIEWLLREGIAMQVTIKDMIEEHGFESPEKAIEWSIANGYQLHEYVDLDTHQERTVAPEAAVQLCERDPGLVFIQANALGFNNPRG